MRFRPISLNEYMSRGLLVVLVAVFTATMAATIFFTYTMIRLNSLTQQTGEDVRAAFVLQDLMLNLRQAESGQRGYIITGTESYLTAYSQATKKMPEDVSTIRRQESLEGYGPQIDQLDKLVRLRIEDLDEAISARKTGGVDAAAAVVSRTQKSLYTAQIKDLTDKIGKNTFDSIRPQQEQSRQAVKRSLIITVVLDVFILAMCIIIVRYFQHAIVKERAIEGAKSEFLSLASHQLRTPATGVKQYLGMLQDGFFGKVTAEQKDALRIAYNSNETGIGIINSLLNAAKLSLGKIQLTRKPVGVTGLVQQVADEYREQIATKQQTIEVDSTLGKRKVRLDPAYFKSIVENLVDNASKYSPEGATITIRLRSKPEKKQFTLTVADNGIGIEKQDFDKLFLKFSRLQNEYSETSEGSGLGLYWVKQIVALHGGTVAVRSTIGKGTRFIVTMPA